MKSMKLTRRGLLGAMSGASAAAMLGRSAQAAAEFDFKLGVNTPESHPLTVRLTEAAKEIGSRSAGRLNVSVFANSQLGGDPEMLSQVRSGGIELLAVPSMTLTTLVPLSGLPSIGFAFASYDQVWAAMDATSAISFAMPSRKRVSCRCSGNGTTVFARSPRPPAGSSTASTT
jgi:TRAP-type C4-dicarboxylate transport system substrate-binding protein